MSRERAEVRLARLLAVVPWVAARDGPPVEEVCRRFGVEETDLLEDLNLLFMCGLYPFTPDMLIEVTVADGRVWITMADYFRRPLRLNPQEGLALAAAASAFLELSGAGPSSPLATALDKLQNLLGAGPDEGLQVELGAVEPALLETVCRAADSRHKLEVEYYSFGRDEATKRVIRPWSVFNAEGQWYVSAWCELADAERLFRLDRISGVVETGQRFEAPDAAPAGVRPLYSPGAGDVRVVLDLRPPAHWIAEQYPNDGVETREDGILRVTLRSGQRPWLERLLLRAGPDASMVEGDASIGPAAAARVLARYRTPQGDGIT